MTFQAIFGLVVMAVQLLVSANQPGISPEQRQVAITTANTSINAAVEYLQNMPATSEPTSSPTGAGTGTPIIPPTVQETTSTPPVPAYSIKILDNAITKDGGYVQFQILGSDGKPLVYGYNFDRGTTYIQYDLLRFNGSNRPYSNTCGKSGVEKDSYFLNFKGLADDQNVSIDSDNNLTLHVEWCGNVAETKVKIGE